MKSNISQINEYIPCPPTALDCLVHARGFQGYQIDPLARHSYLTTAETNNWRQIQQVVVILC